MVKKIFILIFLVLQVIWANFLPSFYNISADSTAPVFVVDKARQMFYIYHSDGPGRISVLDSIKASTGTIRGDKRVEGDKKTPEGVYKIIRKVDSDRLPEIYGPLALILDYPNIVDRVHGNGGSNIWLHGRNEKLAPRQTEGCVSLENHSILKVNEQFVKLGQTKIIIYDSLENRNAANYHKGLKEWEKRLQTWRDAWQFGDFDTYEKCYAKKFQDYKSLEAYVARKNRIDRNTAWKKINTEKVLALVADYEARLVFEQEYITPDFISLGNKELTLYKEKDDWKIVAERFTPIQGQVDFANSIHEYIATWEQRQEERSIDSVKLVINNISTGLNSDTIYSAFTITKLFNNRFVESNCKLYLDYENGKWHLVSDKYNDQQESSLAEFQENFLNQWVKSWNAGEIDEYLKLYSKRNFKTEEGDYDNFASRKKRLDKLYSWIDVDIKNAKAKIQAENLILEFIQNYKCPKFFSKGQKKLILAREAKGWKIINEQFESLAKNEIQPQLVNFVDKWQKTWEAKNIDSYIEYYASEFTSGNFDRQSWYADKKEKFAESENIKVEVANFRINSPKQYVWHVTFDQAYSSGSYSDQGNKLLVIQGKPGNFKIINEKWWQ